MILSGVNSCLSLTVTCYIDLLQPFTQLLISYSCFIFLQAVRETLQSAVVPGQQSQGSSSGSVTPLAGQGPRVDRAAQMVCAAAAAAPPTPPPPAARAQARPPMLFSTAGDLLTCCPNHHFDHSDALLRCLCRSASSKGSAFCARAVVNFLLCTFQKTEEQKSTTHLTGC